MILSDTSLTRMLPTLVGHNDQSLVNPASIDIRIGRFLMEEHENGTFQKVEVGDQSNPYILHPGQFVLVDTLEVLTVPNGYAVELKLKSSRAREGYDHSLAFWFDPGWVGIGTMEVCSRRQHARLPLWTGMRFGQVIVHELDAPAARPYQGRYQSATEVEQSKGHEQ